MPAMSMHRSLMTPKRGSSRFTVTRADLQLDPRDVRLPDIRVKPIPCGAGGKTAYRLSLEESSDNICGLDALAEELSTAGLNLHVSAVENILNTLLDVIPRYIARTGKAVRIGNLMTLKPYVTGTLDNANDEPDPAKSHVEIRATVSPALRHSLAKARLVNVKHRRNVIDRVICNMNGAVVDVVDVNHDIGVSGRNIYVPCQPATAEDARGRVWIETLDGVRLGRCAVLNSGPDLLTVRFVPDMPVSVGEARLVVETYGTKEAADAGDKSALARYDRVIRFA